MSFPVPLPSTFMPLPLAIMIPFMGIQSGVMAQQFGMNFQFGKRKISAMSNEEFNKLTPEQMQADFSNMIKGLIPTFGDSLRDMRPFQRMIFEEMLAVFKTAVDLGIDVAVAGAEGVAHGLGTHAIQHGEEELPTIDEHKFLSPLEKRIHERHGHGHLIGQTTVISPTVPPKVIVSPKLEVQQPVVPTIPKVKIKAGQSQIIERNRLIREIARMGNLLKQMSALNKSGKTVAPKGDIDRVKRLLLALQQKLVNLLARYQF